MSTFYVGHEVAFSIMHTDLNGLEALMQLGDIKNHIQIVPNGRKYRFDVQELIALKSKLDAAQFMFCQRKLVA